MLSKYTLKICTPVKCKMCKYLPHFYAEDFIIILAWLMTITNLVISHNIIIGFQSILIVNEWPESLNAEKYERKNRETVKPKLE
jgi:hypothetical protein